MLDYITAITESHIHESSYVSKLLISSKIKKYNKKNDTNIKGMYDLLKHHSNPGLDHYIQRSNDVNELNYIKADTKTVLPTLNKIKDRMELIEKYGECKQTQSYYKGLKNMYIDKGITVKDVELTIEGINHTIDLINERIKIVKQERIKK